MHDTFFVWLLVVWVLFCTVSTIYTVKGRLEQDRVRNRLFKSSGMCNLNYTTEVITMAAFRHIVIFLLFSPFLFYSCDSVNSNSGSNGSGPTDSASDREWLIPKDQVFIGAGRDGIPSIDNPGFRPVDEIDFLGDDELILGIKVNGEIRGYPHQILNYHEIINDAFDQVPIAVAFCPLTGSAIAWTRIINGEVTTFGVSGLIHKNNLIAYDRATETQWSQMMELGVNGELIGERPEPHKIIEMNWKTWKIIFPNSKVLSGRIGFDRNYSLYPYGQNYASDNNNLLFPIHLEDDRLERKTLAHGVFYDKNLHVFPVESFPDTVVVLNRIIAGNEIVVAGSSGHKLIVSFSSKAGDGTVLRFAASDEELPVIMGDEEGNLWNVFGECVGGPRSGEKLKRIPSYNAYWFAWVDFFGDGLRAPIIVFP